MSEVLINSKIDTLKLGWISYWNLMPLGKELAKQQYGNIEQVAGHPTQVNQWLREGLVSIAPCSSVNLTLDLQSDIALPLGVSSNGPVLSVYLGFNKQDEFWYHHILERQMMLRKIIENAQTQFGFNFRRMAKYIWSEALSLAPIALEKAPQIKFSNASATSVALSKILYKLWFGDAAFELNCTKNLNVTNENAIELVIGDEALIRRSSFHKIIDLGAVWKELTNLPFVFAVWQNMGKAIDGWHKIILNAAEEAEKNMRQQPSQYYPANLPLDESGKDIALNEYWQCINYRLGTEEFKGLLLYLSLNQLMQTDNVNSDAYALKIEEWALRLANLSSHQ